MRKGQEKESSDFGAAPAPTARHGSRRNNTTGDLDVEEDRRFFSPTAPSRRRRPMFVPSSSNSNNNNNSNSEQQPSDLGNDDSFSDERFISGDFGGAGMGNASWDESPSFDDGDDTRPHVPSNYPSRGSSSQRDRRKRFDTTTPTLIDEEELVDLEDYDRPDAEGLSLADQPPAPVPAPPPPPPPGYDALPAEESWRYGRTPITRNRKASHTARTSMEDLRRTPGASEMHSGGRLFQHAQSSSKQRPLSLHSTSVHSLQPSDESGSSSGGLGFGLTLTTPVGSSSGGGERSNQFTSGSSIGTTGFSSRFRSSAHQSSSSSSSRLWRENTSESRTPSPKTRSNEGRHQQQPPPQAPFASAPWTRTSNTTKTEEARASGAFSPNILRLTEDIGNLLQEDEDDDYTLEIPSVFRGDNDDLSEFAEDWTGSYVFDSLAGPTTKPIVPRPSTSLKDGRTRRRPSAAGQPTFLQNAQQPKPRRSGNEGFDLTKTMREEHHQSVSQPQLFHLGGAFVPPAHSASYFRPSVDQSRLPFGTTALPHAAQQAPFGFQPGAVAAGLRTHAFDPIQYEATQHSGATSSGYFNQINTFGQHMGGAGYAPQGSAFGVMGAATVPYPQPPSSQALSDMQPTAREFVPMSTRSGSTPQPYAVKQQWPPATAHGPPMVFESTVEPHPPQAPGAWPHTTASYGYRTTTPFCYPTPPQPPPVVGPTPVQSWHVPAEPVRFAFGSQHSTGPSPHPPGVESVHAAHAPVTAAAIPFKAPAAPAAPTQGTTSMPMAGPDVSYRELRGKKDTKRGKKGKKKSQKSDSSSTGTGRKTPGSRKKGKGELPRPGSTTQSQDGNETIPSSSEMESKRADLIESPSTRVAFKDFYRSFRGEERVSFQKAEEFALSALDDGSLPGSVHWRVYLELADLAKRANRYPEARRLYQKVCQLQPYASQGWLEYSKLEEECGHMNRVMNIVHAGLEYCEYSENLLTRAVRHQEKMGNLANARGLLSRLKHVGIERVWRTVLEGALLEGRAGNYATSRRVLKYLMHHVPWYGPLYLEAYRLERDQGNSTDALSIVERGLEAIPRYGPLWFGSFRLCEEMDLSEKKYDLPRTMEMIERAKSSISKELVWKVHLEASHMLQRAALCQASVGDPSLDDLLAPARHRLALTVLTCPNNLRWKVWLDAARMELGLGNTERSRALFLRAHKIVPDKGRSATLLECARLEEFTGDTELARAILCRGRVEYGHDWKVWLEGVLLEMRNSRFQRAFEICRWALEIHPGTGRLWASLVQLSHFCGRDVAQDIALRRALNIVPKSGEVWCEGARIHLNPFSDTFDPERARRHLHFATKFTPQYGDSFIETLRLEVILQWLLPIVDFIWEKTDPSFPPGRSESENEEHLITYVTNMALVVAVARQKEGENIGPKDLAHRTLIPTLRKRLKAETLSSSIDLTDLRLTCSNADPNYGSLWFHCRRAVNDAPRRVIEDAAGDIADEVHKYAHVYIAAALRRKAILSAACLARPPELDESIETSDPAIIRWEDEADERLRASPSLEEIFRLVDPSSGVALVETTTTGQLFVTGLSEMNKHLPIERQSLGRRRRTLFGNDALFP